MTEVDLYFNMTRSPFS